MSIKQTYTIRSDDPNAEMRGDLHELFFQFSPLRAGFSKASRSNDHCMDSPLGTFIQDISHTSCWDQYDCQVDWIWQVHHGYVHGSSKQTATFWINKVDYALIIT